jgi:hypothetical protein
VSDIGIASANAPLPKADDVCAACGEVIEDRVAVFSGAGRGSVFHESCFGDREPVVEEPDRD